MTDPAKSSAGRRAIARLSLARAEAPAPQRGRPPVFHVFEELYARTLSDTEPRSCGATLAAER